MTGAATAAVKIITAEPGLPRKRCIGIDLGKRLAVCEVLDDQVVYQAMLTRAELEQILGHGSKPARIAIEACREAWFYHDLLTSWGHEVLLVDTTRVRELGIGHGRRKNDRIDAETLARAVVSGRIPLAHVLSPERRQLRAQLGVRSTLVDMRSVLVVSVRGLLRSWGVTGVRAEPENLAAKVRALRLEPSQRELLEPLLSTLEDIGPRIAKLDRKVKAIVEGIDIAKLLTTCPGVGPIVACSFISVIDEAARFRSAHQVEAYLGLVPSEHTSGKRKLGSITKTGNAYLRSLLVQAAWSILNSRRATALKTWGHAIAKRRGKNIAAIAVARRLAGILWAMWRDGTVYEPHFKGQVAA